MKIEVGKEYKTRGGGKVFNVENYYSPYENGYALYCDIKDGNSDPRDIKLTTNGRYWAHDCDHIWDIVSEWNDHPYPIGKMIPWEATEDSVCPLPGNTKATLYFGMSGSSITEYPQGRSWEVLENFEYQIIGFVVHAYPKEEQTYWMRMYGDEGFGTPFVSKDELLAGNMTNSTALINYKIQDGKFVLISQEKVNG